MENSIAIPVQNVLIVGVLVAMILSGVGGIVFLIVYLSRQRKEK